MSNEPVAAANKSESIMFLLMLEEAARRCLVIDVVLLFIVTFEHISHLFPAFLLLTLNKSLLAEMVKINCRFDTTEVLFLLSLA